MPILGSHDTAITGTRINLPNIFFANFVCHSIELHGSKRKGNNFASSTHFEDNYRTVPGQVVNHSLTFMPLDSANGDGEANSFG